MEDTNFVILIIRILVRLNFSEVSQGRHCIADIRKKVFFWFCRKVQKGKMDLVGKLVTAMDEELPIVTINSFETDFNVKGYHVYQGIWSPKIGEHYQKEENPVILKTNTLLCTKWRF